MLFPKDTLKKPKPVGMNIVILDLENANEELTFR
jgi:hypothetical protein